MPDRETWKFLNTFAGWVSAAATFTAVVTSLYLARRSDRVLLNLALGIRALAVEGGGPGHGSEYVWLSVTNIGRRQATLVNLFWKPFPWGKSGWVWVAPRNQFSSPFPHTLADGEAANYVSPVAEFKSNFRDIARHSLLGPTGLLRLHLLRFKVSTSTGRVFSTRPEKSLRNLLRQVALEGKDHGADTYRTKGGDA
jgi:hypothetical protein